MTRSTKRSTNRSTDRSASDREFTNGCPIKTGEELKQIMHRPDPRIAVRRSSIVSLKMWAERSRNEDRYELNKSDAAYSKIFWHGFISAIDEILQMEDS